MSRSICIHGHFYQPPRENPWLEEVEVQDSAYPYHDWNRRVTSECYKPNTASRILDKKERIVDILNNYSRISFNFGPTILSWMEEKEPEVYQAIIEADKKSRERFSGHGSAIAQCYNHVIMPLASTRDKITQVIWGIADFENRFDRKPEGMWIPETAVDVETLDIMAEQGIKYTILSQHQAKRIRKKGEKKWYDLEEKEDLVDPKRPYLCTLPSGREITIFYYDMSVSKAVAFENILNNGEDFANRLTESFVEGEETSQIVNIATDGESYGHHHEHGEMALSYCLHFIESNDLAEITNYGEYLEKHPPDWETEILENSSWSCVHGIERWRGDCGCSTGGRPGWNQSWRKPLREALEWLKGELDRIYADNMAEFTDEPWKIRNRYIRAINERSEENMDDFFESQFSREIKIEERSRILKLLEIERNGMLMFTSCGWFFSDISGVETVQIIMYASRALQLGEEIERGDLGTDFESKLSLAESNMKSHGNGKNIYRKMVKPARLDLLRVCGHYAVSSIFRNYSKVHHLYFYTVKQNQFEILNIGNLTLALGNVNIRSRITLDSGEFSFAVLHMGDHNMLGGVEKNKPYQDFKSISDEIRENFEKTDIPEMIRLIDNNFRDHNYTLWHMFRDEQRDVVDRLLMPTIKEAEDQYRKHFENYYPIVIFMKELDIPIPRHLRLVVDLVVNSDLVKVLSEEEIDNDYLESVVKLVEKTDPNMDVKNISLLAKKRVTEQMRKLQDNPDDESRMEGIVNLLKTFKRLDLDINFREAQNILFDMNIRHFRKILEKFDEDEADEASRRKVDLFRELGDELGVNVH